MNGNSCSGKRIAVTRQSTTERYTVTALQYKIHDPIGQKKFYTIYLYIFIYINI